VSDQSPVPGPGRPDEPAGPAAQQRGTDRIIATDSLGLAATGEQPVVGGPDSPEQPEAPRYDDAVDDVPPADTVGPVPVPPTLRRATGSALPVRIALGLVAVLLVGGLGWYFGRDTDDATGGANVGDCLAESVVETPPTDPTQVSTVACDAPEATYRIVGLIEDRDKSDGSADEACAGFPMTTGLWIGREQGSVYCLETVAK